MSNIEFTVEAKNIAYATICLIKENGQSISTREVINAIQLEGSIHDPETAEQQLLSLFPLAPGRTLDDPVILQVEGIWLQMRSCIFAEAMETIKSVHDATGIPCGLLFAIIAYTPVILRNGLSKSEYEATFRLLKPGAGRAELAKVLDQATKLASIPSQAAHLLHGISEQLVRDMARLIRTIGATELYDGPEREMELANHWCSAMRSASFGKDGRIPSLPEYLHQWAVADSRHVPLRDLVLDRRVQGEFYFQHAILAALILANSKCYGGFGGTLRVISWCQSEHERWALMFILSAFRIPHSLFVRTGEAKASIPLTASMALVDTMHGSDDGDDQMRRITAQLADRSKHRRYLVLHADSSDMTAGASLDWRRRILQDDMLDAVFYIHGGEGEANHLLLLDNAKQASDKGVVFSCVWAADLWKRCKAVNDELEEATRSLADSMGVMWAKELLTKSIDRGSFLEEFHAVKYPVAHLLNRPEVPITPLILRHMPFRGLYRSVPDADVLGYVPISDVVDAWLDTDEPQREVASVAISKYIGLELLEGRPELFMRAVTPNDEGRIVKEPALIRQLNGGTNCMVVNEPVMIGPELTAGRLDLTRVDPIYLAREIQAPYFRAQLEILMKAVDIDLFECGIRIPVLDEQKALVAKQDRSWGMLPMNRKMDEEWIQNLVDNILTWAPENRERCVSNTKYIVDEIRRTEREEGLLHAEASVQDIRHELGHLRAGVINALDRLRLWSEHTPTGMGVTSMLPPRELVSSLTQSVDRYMTDSRQLLDSLLSDFAAERYESSVFDVRELVDEVFGAIGPIDRVSFMNALPIGKSIVRGDRDKVKHIIRGLVQNAFQHGMPDKERMTIKIDYLSNSEELTILVGNNGKPMDLPMEEAIKRGKRSRKSSGSGLGLSIARKWVLGMGGEFCRFRMDQMIAAMGTGNPPYTVCFDLTLPKARQATSP